MHDDATSRRRPLDEPFDAILDRQLTPQARRFVAEHADFLVRVDFRDIADHPHVHIRSTEGYYASAGARHTIWLDKESADFEALLLHETMRGILVERGYPRTACTPDAASCIPMRYLSSLLGSAVMDPIIDGWLTKGGYRVYDREVLTRRAIAEAWLDAPRPNPARYTFLFCKWTLLTVLLMLDSSFEGETVNLLHAIIRRNFSEPWGVAEELSESITGRGFAEPHSALTAMLQLRNVLNLEDKVSLVDAEGTRL